MREAVTDGFVLLGAGVLSYGAWLHYDPAGFVVGGACLVVMGVLTAIGGRHAG